jgi:hypothetical protein
VLNYRSFRLHYLSMSCKLLEKNIIALQREMGGNLNSFFVFVCTEETLMLLQNLLAPVFKVDSLTLHSI